MLPRERRLNADRDWNTLFEEGFSVSGPLIAMRVRPHVGQRRVGVSVGKKVGGAVARNRVKRRLRELARRHWDILPEADVALLARPITGRASFSDLECALMDLAARAARKIRANAEREPAP